jgi:hypothetical protein
MLVPSHHPNLKLVSEDVLTLIGTIQFAPPHFNVIIGWWHLTMEPAEAITTSVTRSETTLAIPQGIIPPDIFIRAIIF